MVQGESTRIRLGWPDTGEAELDEVREVLESGMLTMGPKVEALCRFVDQTGGTAVITDLDHIAAAIRRQAGTVVVPDPQDNRRETP